MEPVHSCSIGTYPWKLYKQKQSVYFGIVILITYKKIDETLDFSTKESAFCFKHSGVQFWSFMQVIR